MYYKCTECGNVTAFPKIKTEYCGCGYSESYLACDCCNGIIGFFEQNGNRSKTNDRT